MLIDAATSTLLLAHLEPATPDDFWSRWHADPLILLTLGTAVVLHRAGARPSDTPWRRRMFMVGIGVIALALLSPIDAAADALATAHMVQHVLLATVAAPFIVFARPGPALTRPLPRGPTLAANRGARRLWLAGRTSLLRRPGTVLVVFTAVFWFWHAPEAYELALRSDVAHALSHASYLAAGMLLWRTVRDAGRSGGHGTAGAVGLLFAVGLQGTLLGALMTFSAEPWYGSYVGTAPEWGLDALTDQQLAALVMWFPSGIAYLGAALWVLRTWLVDPTPPSRSAADPRVHGHVGGGSARPFRRTTS